MIFPDVFVRFVEPQTIGEAGSFHGREQCVDFIRAVVTDTVDEEPGYAVDATTINA
jgi:hypothetical protein